MAEDQARQGDSVQTQRHQPRAMLVSKADLHMHTAHGDGLDTPEACVDWAEQQTDLALIAITDHDEVEAGLRARDYALRQGYRVAVVPGVEITTRGGHLLALDVERPFRMLRPLEESVDEVLAAGGICIAPHPCSWLTTSIGERGLQRLLPPGGPAKLSGIELWNPSLAGKVCHERARVANVLRWQLAETGGSDAHAAEFIGSAYTTFPGHTWADFKRALAERTTHAYGRFWTAAEVRPIAVKQTARAWFVTPAVKVRRTLARRGAAEGTPEATTS
ncbi:MAG TPA: PHP-associated domain-containing protein [Thermomicrobiales bacterium]|nr:PHP-associated domain-containing protein [Thermomicrobiales bacterium]